MRRLITPIGDIVKSVFSQLENAQVLCKEDVEKEWKNIAGDGAARHSKPETLRKGVLTVRVDSSVWMQELTMKKRNLLKGLKRAFGKDKIAEIHFKIGEI